MTLETLRALQTRIREATGPDRKLDVAIWDAFCASANPLRIPSGPFPPPFTTDPDGLGACVALMHATLPGCDYGVGCDIGDDEHKSFCQAYVGLRQWAGDASGVRVYTGKSAYDAPSLAILQAITAAKIAELEAEQERIER